MYFFNLITLLGITFLISTSAVATPVLSDKADAEAELSITILYDNYSVTEGTRQDEGFSCLIKTHKKTILFDTGNNSEILLQNAEILGVNLAAIDQVVISHNHPDHTGGLDVILQKNPGILVYFPISFPESFIEKIIKGNGVPIRVAEPLRIGKNVYITGEMGEQNKEQSLILDTRDGLVILTGCSHQGIVNILQLAQKMFHKEIILVLGGFHLESYGISQIEEIIEEFENLGVQQCGASHCTGDAALALFKQTYGENFITMGVGKVIRYSY